MQNEVEVVLVGAILGEPFFINVNFMKVHQPNLPAPEFELKSMSKTKFADSIVELDTRIGRIMDKLRAYAAMHRIVTRKLLPAIS